MKRSKRIDKSVMPLALILITISAASIFGYFRLRIDAFTNQLKERSPIAVLFVFSEAGRIRFLDLFLYHPITKKAGLFYIPPSTGSRIESVDRFDKIEVLYDSDDMQPLKQKIEQLSDLSIPFYIDISFDDIGHMVDLLGGLELFISNPVDGEDSGKRLLLPSGSVLLDGSKVKDYVIYEEQLEEEEEHVRRKQKFVSALLRRISTPAVNAFVLHRRVFPYFSSYVHTNLNSRALRSFIQELAKLQVDRLLTQGQRVLGTYKSVEGVEGEVLFPHHDGNLMKQTIAQNLASISSEDQSYDDTTLVTMEILNGTNQDGLAERTKVLFESFGFEVITYRNADHDQYINSVIIDRKGTIQWAERAAEVIQCERVYTKIEEGVDVDVTLILGKDFDGRYCK